MKQCRHANDVGAQCFCNSDRVEIFFLQGERIFLHDHDNDVLPDDCEDEMTDLKPVSSLPPSPSLLQQYIPSPLVGEG